MSTTPSRRGFVGFGLSAVGASLAPAQTRERPNILFVMTDQQRFDAMGAAGNSIIKTPNLDRLAREGALFRRAYSSTPTCTPARSALLTGLAPWNHGMLGYDTIPKRFAFEKPRAMAEAGYSTTSIGKNHFDPWRQSHGYERTFLDEACACGNVHDADIRARRATEERTDYEAWFYSQAPNRNPHATGLGWNDYAARPFALPEELHPTAWTGDMARRFLDTYSDPRPFYLKVSFLRPHSPYDPPARYMDPYLQQDIPSANVAPWARRYEARSSDRPDIWHGRLDKATIRNSRAGYYGCVTQVDDQIGRIIETLEKRKLLDRTLIVFTSDHGDMLGDQNLWRKSYAYESSARIPMIVRWPEGLVSAKRGQTIDSPVELRDIFPTFLDAAGASTQRELDGDSLLKLLRDPKARWRTLLDLEHNVCYSPKNNWNALTDGKQKYIFHALDGEEQLFDLTKDPRENINLASEPAFNQELRLWRQRMILHLEKRGEEYVSNGRLALRPKGRNTSPNLPKS